MRRLLICKALAALLLMGLFLSSCGRKDKFLPEATNDTIFTAIGDETDGGTDPFDETHQ